MTADERRIDYVDLRELQGSVLNPKKHADAEIEASVERFGFTEPLILDERTNRLVSGHGRLATLRALEAKGGPPPPGVVAGEGRGWKVPVVRGWSSRDDVEASAYLLAANQLTIAGGWNDSELGPMLARLAELDALAGTGFSQDDLDRLLGEVGVEMPPDVDDVPELSDEPWVRKGDVFELGSHRLGCGDSTHEDVVRKVLRDDVPSLVFTDPPYGIAYKAMRGGDAIENDESPEKAEQTLVDALAFGHAAEAAFVCCDWRSLEMTRRAMVSAGFEPKACIVWDKMRGVQNLDRFHKQHEFIVYAGPYGGQPTVAGDVWQVARDFEPDHPTPKPVELVRKAIEAASKKGAIVFEPFSGSGSTLCACEVSGRRARAIELDPRYVQATLERWEKLTGKKAKKLGGTDGT